MCHTHLQLSSTEELHNHNFKVENELEEVFIFISGMVLNSGKRNYMLMFGFENKYNYFIMYVCMYGPDAYIHTYMHICEISEFSI